MALSRDYSLSVWNPIGSTILPFVQVDAIKIDPEITALKFSSQIGTGYAACTAGFLDHSLGTRQPWLAEPINLPPFAHIEVWSGNAIVWEGRVTQRHFKGADVAGFTAQGYGAHALKDAVFISQSAQEVGAQALFTTAIGNSGPVTFTWTNAQDIQTPAFQTNLAALNGNTPAQIVEQLSKAGDGAQLPWDFGCWEGRTVTFKPRLRPTDSGDNWNPDYLLDFDDQALALTLDDTDSYGAVYVSYTPPGGTQTLSASAYTEPTFVSRYGFQRTGLLAAGGVDATQAAAVAQVWLYQHAWSVVRASLLRKAEEGLRQWPNGAARLPQFVRAGEWVLLGDGSQIAPQIIVRSEMDAFTHVLALEIGAAALGFPALVADLRSTNDHTKAGRSVTSGAAL